MRVFINKKMNDGQRSLMTMNESLAGEYRQSTGKQIVIRITCHSFNQSVSPDPTPPKNELRKNSSIVAIALTLDSKEKEK